MLPKRLGRVQRAIIAAFDAAPTPRFTVRELCAVAYTSGEITPSRLDYVSRAANGLMVPLDLRKDRRALSHGFGWEHVFTRQATFAAMLALARRERWTHKPTDAEQLAAQKGAYDAA